MELAKLLVAGLTGGIGSGKSSFCAAFSRLGIPIIDADVISHQLSYPNSTANCEVAEKLGKQAVLQDGNLNRKWIRECIFNNKEKRTTLEGIFHPLILSEAKKQIQRLSSTHPYCILAVPLLFEQISFLELVDITIVIDCEINEQIKRVMLRSKLTEQQVIQIIKAQMPSKERNKYADIVINNSSGIEDIDGKVSQLHTFLLGKA